MKIFSFDLKRYLSIRYFILLLYLCQFSVAKNVKVFKSGGVYLLDETQFHSPDYLNFDDDIGKKADADDLYDEKLPNLPPYVVWRFGKYSGYTKVPITTRKAPLWSTRKPIKELVTWTTPIFMPITSTEQPRFETKKVRVGNEIQHIFVQVTTPIQVTTTSQSVEKEETTTPNHIQEDTTTKVEDEKTTTTNTTTTPFVETMTNEPNEFTPQPRSFAKNFPPARIPWSIWQGDKENPQSETATHRSSIHDSDHKKVPHKSAPVWVPWWKTTPSSTKRITTPTQPKSITTPLPKIYTIMGMDRTAFTIPIATRGKLNLGEDSEGAIPQESTETRDQIRQMFEFGPNTQRPVTVFPINRHIEQHVHSNTIFLKLNGGQLFKARVETTTEEARQNPTAEEPQPETPRPKSRPFFRPLEESQTRSRIGSTSVSAQLRINEGSDQNPNPSNETPVPKPVLIRHMDQQFHGPTYKCRILNPTEDGRPSPNTDETCQLVYPGFSADGSCHCTYAVESRDAQGCATGFLYTCRRLYWPAKPITPKPASTAEEFLQ